MRSGLGHAMTAAVLGWPVMSGAGGTVHDSLSRAGQQQRVRLIQDFRELVHDARAQIEQCDGSSTTAWALLTRQIVNDPRFSADPTLLPQLLANLCVAVAQNGGRHRAGEAPRDELRSDPLS